MAGLQEARAAYLEALAAGDEERAERIGKQFDAYNEPRPEPPPEFDLAEPEPEPTGSMSPLSVAGEFSAAANRGVMDTLDFLGPGTANAALRLMGSDYQLPTFAGAWQETPGGEGGFMPEGTERDVVQAAGYVAPAAGAMVPAAGRNLAQAPGIIAEILGFGSAAPATAPGTSALADATNSILFAGREGPQVPMARRADAAGFPISPGDRYGNRTLKNVESAIESTPMPFNPMHRQADVRQQMMNRAGARAVGLDPRTPLIDETVGDVAAELSGEFKRLQDLDMLEETGPFVDELVSIQDRSRTRLFQDPDIESTINKIFDRLEPGGLSLEDYQDMSSELKAKARQAWRGESPDPYFAETLGEIVEALDNLAIDSASPLDMERLRQARKNWRALSQLEKSRAIHESGNVSGQLLGNYLRRTDKSGYTRGGNRSELYETARLTKAFPNRPDSGTASRSFINQLINNPVAGGLGLLMAPVTSTLANAYYRGTPLMMRSAARTGMNPGLATRVGGYLEDDDEPR